MISVLGAGVAGLCAATALAERGLAVEVIEPDGAPAPVSLLAGGMLAPFCEGEAAPAQVVQMGRSAAVTVKCAKDFVRYLVRYPRSRTSGENLFVVLLMMLHPAQELEPPANPVRFTWLTRQMHGWLMRK